jgi:eukaryotic-like serine/threonine-protein kinase
MDRRADPRVSVLRGIVLPERYEPIRRIASGGMATVWCARDRTLDREVAIKLLAEPFAHDEVSGRRFKREARLAARLSGHSNVVTIYDVGQATSSETPLGQPFIVMEYLPGGTVSQALRGEQVDRATAVQWLHQAASALDYAHGRGVIHRDIKLANFLLDRDRVLHVADFGIAQLGTDDTLTAAGQVLGTAAYLAPERALGQPATEASDRYALAVAAFELLAGERPFTAEHFTAQARQHIEDPPPRASRRNPELPVALDAVLVRGIAKRPEQRYSTARELAEAVDQALAGRGAGRTLAAVPTQITRTLPAAAPGDGGRARTAAFAALAAAALGVGIAAGASGGGTPVRSRSAPRLHSLGHPLAAQRPAPPPPVRSTPAKPKPTTTHAAPPPAPAPIGADALEAQGHQLMIGGNYNTAIPVLRHAVATATPASLTYAYALYDLGHSLRLAGDPRAAVPILWRRLQIPNQTGVVRAELALALRALGQQSGGAAPGPKRSPDHPGPTAGSGQGD